MESKTLSALLEGAKELAVRAGQAIQEVAAAGVEVQTKADDSPLTCADLASHETICQGLVALEPPSPILSEEGDLERFQQGSWQRFWCVDPLDGTKEFLKGLDEYTVNIALIEQGRPILGVVYAPAQEVLYYAARGQGAYKADLPAAPKPIAPSDNGSPAVAVVSRSHLSAETQEFLNRLGVPETIQRGSSLKICAIAEGSADIYPRHGPTNLWDTAAGAAVAIEAGCEVTDLDGAALSYDPVDGLKRPGFLVFPSGLRPVIEKYLAG